MQVETLFFQAVGIDDVEEREHFIDESNASDEVKCQTRKLLEAHDHPDSDLLEPFALDATVSTTPIAEGPGTRIGPYKLLQQIGEGGFGIVFMAERVEEIQQKVAVKIVKPGMDTKSIIARFEAERQALALMNHPNIAQVLDAGATETGRPYFVMELVKGESITQYCDKAELTTNERLELFAQVCNAVQHAHQRGVIHRDLKPSNILVTTIDGNPVVKVIDFGVAKALNQRLTEKTLFTAYGHMIGPPQYMSPEQAELSVLDVDTRTDVYSLGVLLYELLTGTTPVQKKRIASAAFDELRRIIREDEPELPSQRLSTLGQAATSFASKQGSQPDALRRYLRGDLDWIVLKSLEKDRSRRYESPKSLAEDVERFLQLRPIEARRPSPIYRGTKWIKRNTQGVVATAVAACFIALTACVIHYWSKDTTEMKASPEALFALGKNQVDEGELSQAEKTFKQCMDAVKSDLNKTTDREKKFKILEDLIGHLCAVQIAQGKYAEMFDGIERLKSIVRERGISKDDETQIDKLATDFTWLAAVHLFIRNNPDAKSEQLKRFAEESQEDTLRAFAALRNGDRKVAEEIIVEHKPTHDNGLFELIAAETLSQSDGETAALMYAIGLKRLEEAKWMQSHEFFGWREFHRVLLLYSNQLQPIFSAQSLELNRGRLEAIVNRFPNYANDYIWEELGFEYIETDQRELAFAAFSKAYALGEKTSIWSAGLLALRMNKPESFDKLVDAAILQFDDNSNGNWHFDYPKFITLLAIDPKCQVASQWNEILKRCDEKQSGNRFNIKIAYALIAIRNQDWDASKQAISRFPKKHILNDCLSALRFAKLGEFDSAKEHLSAAIRNCQEARERGAIPHRNWYFNEMLLTEIIDQEVTALLGETARDPIGETTSD